MAIQQTRPQSRRARRMRLESLFATLVTVILGLLALLVVGLITPILWTALTAQPTTSSCDVIKHPEERAACLQRQREQDASHPAKGAIVPAPAR